MICTTVLVYCLCALVAVFQSTSPDAFLTSLTSAFNTPALSAVTNVLHLAGLAPRPTLPAPEVDSFIDSLLNDIKIDHMRTAYDYVLYAQPLELELGNSYLEDLRVLGYCSVKLSRKYLRPAAAILCVSLGLLLLCSPITVHQNKIQKKSQRIRGYLKPDITTRMGDIMYKTPIQNALRIVFPAAEFEGLAEPLPIATAVSLSSDALGATALKLNTASVYDALFDSSPGTVIFEPITEPLDVVGQLNAEEVHILDTEATEEEAWQTYLWTHTEGEQSGEEECSDEDHG